MGEWIRFWIVAAILMCGIIAFIMATVGVLRFGFVMNRMHASGIGDSLGLGCVVIAMIVASGLNLASLKLLLLILFGGLALNLTPCVLPMIPVNLLVIGKSAVRGLLYGLGIAMAYGALGVAAAVGGLAFGTIQSSPWFNAAVAAVFVALALSLLGVFRIDFSARRFKAGAFLMGVLSAILAGACVAPILVSVLLLTFIF